MTRELNFAHALSIPRTFILTEGWEVGEAGGRGKVCATKVTMSSSPMVFHEQQSAKLSGRHAVNNLLQGPYVTEIDLAAIARELDAAERKLMLANGAETADALRFMAEDSGNVDDSGNFSVSVVREALWRAAGAELIQHGAEVERVLADPSCAEALLLLSEDNHFRALRRLPSGAAEAAGDASTEAWFNLDSELARPEVLRLLDFKKFLLDLRAKGNSIFVVRVPGGRLPAPQLGRVATDATCRWYAAQALVAESISGRSGSAYVGGGGAGGAAAAPAALPQPYEAGPGLALLFADKREARFIAGCGRLEHALALYDYEVRSFDATDVLTHVRVEVAAALKRTPNLSRVVVAYSGHGGMSAAHPMGLLCGQGLDSQSFVRVAELEAVAWTAVSHATPREVPRLLLLDCCYSDYGGRLPPPWIVDPASDSVHDSAILRAASEGHYGYSSVDWSLSHCVADVLETSNGSLSLENLKFAIANGMKQRKTEIEPKLELKMSRPFLFSRGGGAGARR